MRKELRVGVIGAGVNGIGSALAILRSFPELKVTVYSDQFTPFTTGDGAAGLWTPYITSDTPEEDVYRWSKSTWDLFDSWHKENKHGVFLTDVRRISKETLDRPHWKDITIDYREFTQEDLKEFGPEYIDGFTYKAFVAEPAVFLPYLMDEVRALGGEFQRRNIRSLEDMSNKAEIVVNCSGIGARDLVPDPCVYPVRGQVTRISYPKINRCTFDYSGDSWAYIIPNSTSTVLGGTKQENDWRTTIDENDSDTYMQACMKLEPMLKNAEIINEWVGLRPARKGGIRLDTDIISTRSKNIPVIHSYGQGGSGITQFWGCSLNVRDLVGKAVNRIHGPITSKL